ncbi:MAG: TRAP transporter small permease [Planctomycetaceae bacterium]|nr:TRAP transporter small permease [Planctomycetaceae bacterium]
MKVLKWLDKYLEESVLVILLVAMYIILQLQIVMRSTVGSLTWVEELSRYLFVASGFLGISYTVKKKIILKVDIITDFFPESVKKVLNILLMVVSGLFFGYLFYSSFGLAKKMIRFKQTSAAMGMPMWILYVIACIGFGLVVFRCIQDVIGQVRVLSTVVDNEEATVGGTGDLDNLRLSAVEE